MAISQREREAVQAAQMLMGTRSGRNIVPDGWWGTYTQSVYNALGAEDRMYVDAQLASSGFTAQRLKTAFDAEKLMGSKSKRESLDARTVLAQSQKDMAELVKRTAIREGVPPAIGQKIVWLESKFNPRAVSPTGARGLGQFTSIAIKDVAERGGFRMTDPFDPEQNATATMKYIKLVARDMGVPLNDPVKLYMGYNIGPTAARKYLMGKVDDSVRKAISRQAYGSPEVYGSNLAAKITAAPVLA